MAAEHKVVSQAEWLEARKQLLTKEKQFQQLQDELNAERRRLPWERVTKPYVFEGPKGEIAFGDLFAGCPHCSLRADGFNGINVQLRHRDVTMVAISRAPYQMLATYRKRMGWTFPWVSSGDTDFNFDFNVSFTPEAMANGTAFFNYANRDPGNSEREGHSVFLKDDSGDIYHTYSCYTRGNEPLNIHYHYLDMVPQGRDEGGKGPSWVRRHDEYGK